MSHLMLLHGLTITPTKLPYDVLRTLLQAAARADSYTATNLAVLSRAIQPWIEEIIYCDVILSRQSTANAFLRTLTTAKSKYPGFFANAVKSLFICPDVDPIDVVTILSTCRGVVNLSYWPLKHTTSGGVSRVRNAPMHDPWDARTPTGRTSPPRLSPPLVHRRQPKHHQKMSKFAGTVATHNIHHLSPQKLSLLVDETHPIQCFQPSFDVPFFHNVTHLTVVNKWEEWSSWAGHSISEMAMPHLTHVKFDMSVGQAPPEDSRTRWRNTVTDGWSSAASDPEDSSCGSTNSSRSRASTAEEEAQSAWARKINRVARALTDVLTNCRGLAICVLVLRFDSSPARTARQISRLVSAMMSENRVAGFPYVDTQDESAGFDPRLVFAWEKEPFRYSHAHSAHELMIWRAAEAVAKAQSYMSGYTVLNCDYLV